MKSDMPACITIITGMTKPRVLQSSSSLSRRGSVFITSCLAGVWVVAASAPQGASPSVSNYQRQYLHNRLTTFASTPMVPSTRLLLRSGTAFLCRMNSTQQEMTDNRISKLTYLPSLRPITHRPRHPGRRSPCIARKHSPSLLHPSLALWSGRGHVRS
jgi:hypothetical protein